MSAAERDWRTRPFPPASEAMQTPGLRISGVYFWQGHWNYNFWSNFDGGSVDAELTRLAGLHFNTCLISLPWGVFQTSIAPPEYSDAAFGKLDLLLDGLEAMRMYAILRVGSAEHSPAGIAGGSYDLHTLFLDDLELEAYAGFFFQTARRLRKRTNVLFLLHSWEDLQCFIGLTTADHDRRLTIARDTGTFHAYLRRRSLAEWNRRWGTQYDRFEDVPLPEASSAAMRDLWHFADERLREQVLPKISGAAKAADPSVRLSFEVRIDPDPCFLEAGKTVWVDHQATWRLPDTYDVLSICWNGTWGAQNDGRFLHPDLALSNFRTLLDRLERRAGGRPIFLSQLNVEDSTPGRTFASRLRGEAEILQFLEGALPIVFERTCGYAFWGLEPMESNLLLNSTFASGLNHWNSSWGAAEPPAAEGEFGEGRFLRLPPGSSVSQYVDAPWNPGRASPERPFSVRMDVRSERGGSLSVGFRSPGGLGSLLAGRVEPIPATWTTIHLALPFAGQGRLTMRADGSATVEVRRVSIYNHRQDSAVLGAPGTDVVRRAELFERYNRCWQHGWEDHTSDRQGER